MELEDAGILRVDECRLVPATHQQYYRIFAGLGRPHQAIVGFVMQGVIGFHFTAFTSLSTDGRRWVTWDYPLTYGLSMPPHFLLFRALHCGNRAGSLPGPPRFPGGERGEAPDDLTVMSRLPEEARGQLQRDTEPAGGLQRLARVPGPGQGHGDESFSYSWRGTLYVAGQVLRDLLM